MNDISAEIRQLNEAYKDYANAQRDHSAIGMVQANKRVAQIQKRISELQKLSAPIDNPHYARAARLESEMDALSASGDHEGAAVTRTLMMAALWDWYMSVKRGEK